MSLPLRVLGDRVLIKPDVDPNAPEITEGGIYLAPSLASAVTGEDATLSLTRGTVIGVGTPKHPLHDVAEDLAARLARRHRADDADTVQLLRDLVRREPCVSVGDDVLFARDAGQQITIEDETYIIVREHELLAVIPEEAVA